MGVHLELLVTRLANEDAKPSEYYTDLSSQSQQTCLQQHSE